MLTIPLLNLENYLISGKFYYNKLGICSFSGVNPNAGAFFICRLASIISVIINFANILSTLSENETPIKMFNASSVIK
jgi:hypothetical protein